MAIRWGFPLSRMTTNNEIGPMKFCYNKSFTQLNNPKNVDPSYKTYLDCWDCFGREKKELCLKLKKYGNTFTAEYISTLTTFTASNSSLCQF